MTRRIPIDVRDGSRFAVGKLYELAHTESGDVLAVKVVDIDGDTVTFEMLAVGEA